MSFAQRFLNSSGNAGTGLSVPEARRGCYLTDGLHLYLALGAVGDDAGLIGLEDCYTLEVILVPVEELDFLELVSPGPAAAGDGTAQGGVPPGGAPGRRLADADFGERVSGRL